MEMIVVEAGRRSEVSPAEASGLAVYLRSIGQGNLDDRSFVIILDKHNVFRRLLEYSMCVH